MPHFDLCSLATGCGNTSPSIRLGGQFTRVYAKSSAAKGDFPLARQATGVAKRRGQPAARRNSTSNSGCPDMEQKSFRVMKLYPGILHVFYPKPGKPRRDNISYFELIESALKPHDAAVPVRCLSALAARQRQPALPALLASTSRKCPRTFGGRCELRSTSLSACNGNSAAIWTARANGVWRLPSSAAFTSMR
jgi:hypothetical protein